MSPAAPSAGAEVVTTPEQVGVELRRLREAAGETQAELAKVVRVSRANLTQWESGRYLPSAAKARLLDEHFGMGNALLGMIESARNQGKGPGPVLETAGSLREVFRRAGRALADDLIRDGNGRASGWRHYLRQDDPRTTLATAYGVKAMSLIGEPALDLHPVLADLYGKRSELGWQGRSKGRRPEVTAAVIDALYPASSLLSVEDGLGYLARSLDGYSRTRPFLLTTALRTAVRLRPDAPLTTELADDLLAARLDFGGVLLWGEKKAPHQVAPEPSAAHTARAVVALQALRHNGVDRADVEEAVELGTQWLIARDHPDDGVSDELRLDQPDGAPALRLTIRHFTAAWVVQALAEAPRVPSARLERALAAVWERYESGVGLWAWGSGDLPIWMTLDAITALKAAALAFPAPVLASP
ncbi:helix-turn-helix domain-containing protein [Amycolatopsis sp. DG1A-15b]|jgi:transcriptional regulator with XRE-family HTH domain|nr:helix-turn-helix domain-containing protein [Amycolatopsis sp. DG1A-15b]WIX84433.1 helix-turn-helix domain-containing protein [Amycolatopsis sp. DG1A-15b]